jgi:hypothetical protein
LIQFTLEIDKEKEVNRIKLPSLYIKTKLTARTRTVNPDRTSVTVCFSEKQSLNDENM